MNAIEPSSRGRGLSRLMGRLKKTLGGANRPGGVEKALGGVLQPGEELRSYFMAEEYANPASLLLRGFLPLSLNKSYYVIISDRRVFLLTVARSERAVFADELANVSLVKRSSGRLTGHYTLTHKGEEKPYELKVQKSYSGEVSALIALLERSQSSAEPARVLYRKL